MRDVRQTFQHNGIGVAINDGIDGVVEVQPSLPAFTWHLKRQNLLAQRFTPAVAEQGIPGKRGTG